MTNENDLIQKLMISKKIMEKHSSIPRAGSSGGIIPNTPELQEFAAPQASYNLPQEFIQESRPQVNMTQQPVTKDRIMSSKLPDEIKMLMIEHPIHQPNTMAGPSLSNDLIEKAARLMNNDVANNVSPYQPKKQSVNENVRQQVQSNNFDKETLKDIIRETIEEVLSENGLLVESVNKSNDTFSFKVGKHIFEGKVTKIKKVQ